MAIMALLFKIMATYRRFLMPLQQKTFENVVEKEEISQNKQIFKYYTFISRYFDFFCYMFSKSSAADLFYLGRG